MIWIIPSVTALLIKSFLFFYSNVHKKKYFFYFLISTFFLNLVEMIAFFRLGHDLIVLKLYYCAIVFTTLYLLLTCAEISKTMNHFMRHVSLVISYALNVIILFTNEIVLGYEILPNSSITRTPGGYYFVFQIYVLTSILAAIFILIKRAVYENDRQLKRRCIIAIVGFIPFFILSFVLIALMQLGYKVNAAVLLSLATCIMLFVFISLSDKHALFTMMKFVPFSKEREHYLELRKYIEKLTLPAVGEYIDMKSVFKEMESVVIRNTHNNAESQKEAAQRLNLSESNLSKKMNNKT